ncbi:TFIIH subunit Tfb4/p34 [Lineolata rhizophorae]|uniref:General transcription and DNA repair factor IIH subunit TFB4 n=1 Tax=Lineolata rhizophorae TaxID=578093 RepID=A0A6A6PAT6_9PEZI|nr:TFIIH subunit Tfb4/p34 [Lineolata rhizophorae]
MNAIDGSEHVATEAQAPPPALLTIILDTNPYAWSLLSSTIPLSRAVAALQVFINAHLAINSTNRVAVLASHTQQVNWLYPTAARSSRDDKKSASDGDVDMANGSSEQQLHNGSPAANSADKYGPFQKVEHELMANLRQLMADTTAAELSASTTTQMAGALTTALTYIAKATIQAGSALTGDVGGSLDDAIQGNIVTAGGGGGGSGGAGGAGKDGPLSSTADSSAARRIPLTSRVLILSVSGDLAAQYIPVMNAIFAAQRQHVPIDILKLAGDTVFLQQASDATGGVYVAPSAPQGLLQYLMFGFLADERARHVLVLPSVGEVDFRAACFCHRKVVDVGYVCSVCLSIFCEPLLDGACLTCGTRLALSRTITAIPALIPRKKKKKKKTGGVSTPGTTGAGTPIPAGTPGPS